MYFLIRKYPSYLCRLQSSAIGGPTDQIFHSVNITWQNGQKVLADNKELIPEFFYDPSFLVNNQEADLGLNHLEQSV